METSEDFKNIQDIIRSLEQFKLSIIDATQAQEQEKINNMIEVHFDRCINALAARKVALLSEVNTKFQQQQSRATECNVKVQQVLETCNKLLQTGASIYDVDKKTAEHVWKGAVGLPQPTVDIGKITAFLPGDLLTSIKMHGSVTMELSDSSANASPPSFSSTSFASPNYNLGPNSNLVPSASLGSNSSNSSSPNSNSNAGPRSPSSLGPSNPPNLGPSLNTSSTTVPNSSSNTIQASLPVSTSASVPNSFLPPYTSNSTSNSTSVTRSIPAPMPNPLIPNPNANSSQNTGATLAPLPSSTPAAILTSAPITGPNSFYSPTSTPSPHFYDPKPRRRGSGAAGNNNIYTNPNTYRYFTSALPPSPSSTLPAPAAPTNIYSPFTPTLTNSSSTPSVFPGRNPFIPE